MFGVGFDGCLLLMFYFGGLLIVWGVLCLIVVVGVYYCFDDVYCCLCVI